MTTLILVRHGESEANKEGRFAGQFNASLTEKGLNQAKLAGKYIAENFKIDKAYASDLKRALETGKTIAEMSGLEVVLEPRFQEIRAGEWEGRKFEEIEENYKEDYYLWRTDLGKARPTGGEAVKELGKRVMDGLLAVAKENDGKTVLIATHATPIRAIESYIKTGGFEEMKNIPWVFNASISVLAYDDGKWKFIKRNETEHLGKVQTALPVNV